MAKVAADKSPAIQAFPPGEQGLRLTAKKVDVIEFPVLMHSGIFKPWTKKLVTSVPGT